MTFNCGSNPAVCAETTIVCDDQTECNFICDGASICYRSKFYCNGTANSCNIDCKGTSACYEMDLFSQTNTIITCDGDYSCQRANFDITGDTSSINANVSCRGDDTCRELEVWLRGSAINNNFYLHCADGYPDGRSCVYADVDCLWDSKNCAVECATTDSWSCLDDSNKNFQNLLNCPNNGIGTTCNIIQGFWYYGITFDPSVSPSKNPTQNPSSTPSKMPSETPTTTMTPTVNPTTIPTVNPTTYPTTIPTYLPTSQPSVNPTTYPTNIPTNIPTYLPTIQPSFQPTVSPSAQPTNQPTFDPTSNPTYIPTTQPTKDPTKDPTFNPSINPTFYPTINPTTEPTTNPSKIPSKTPSSNPSVAPSKTPSTSPTPSPTSYERTNNVTSNYVINNNFGINNFTFPAAIGKCMNEYFDSNTYIKYECIDENTAKHFIYNNSNCLNNSISQYIYDKNTTDTEFECDGEENTFIELEIYSSKTCPQSDPTKTSIFIADGVCTSYDSNNNHYRLHCSSYATDDIYSLVEFQYYKDDCSIYGFDENLFSIIEEGSDSGRYCPTEVQQVFGPGIYTKVTDCFTIDSNDTIEPTMIPSKSPTIMPTTMPTTMPIETATTTRETDVSDTSSSLSISDISGYIVLGTVTVLPTLSSIAAFMFHRKREGTDRPGFVSLFKFFISVGDFYTDAIWSLTLYSENNDLWFWAVIFSFGPHILSVVVGLSFITTWRQMKSKVYISQYAVRFDKVIIILTLLSGFYAATDIITSHLFHLDVLSLQISQKQKDRISNLKIINNVILENVPCLYIQYLYLTSTSG
eukprot:504253_1